ncbi:LAGLIDADG family homing endonuclease [Streptomyces sp. NPDC051162]|uniref:LAGLIDADG family homing endonuclease n=1 Tax=unclassified Streptomyces TaxID=2593676 RepID=UPI003433A70C
MPFMDLEDPRYAYMFGFLQAETRITPPRVPFSRRDYLRGVIDADGSVGFTAQGLPFVSLATTSTAIATYLCRYTRQTLGIARLTSRNARDHAYNVLYMREAGVTLAAHLYYPGSLALERKGSAAAEVSAWVRPEHMRPPRPRRSWTRMEDQILLTVPTVDDAAEQLGRSKQSCSTRLWRLRRG